MTELHELQSYQHLQTKNFDCFRQTASEAIEEHIRVAGLLEISPVPFARVDMNLRTICSSIRSASAELEAARERTSRSLSTLSYLISLGNDNAISANTQSLANIAERGQAEAQTMKDIAQATRQDSEAMKTLAQMSMIYLPASIVAVSRLQLLPRVWFPLALLTENSIQ